MRPRALAALLATTAAVVTLLAPVAALAANAPSVRVDRVYWDRRAIDVSVRYSSGTDSVRVLVNGVETTRAVVGPDAGRLTVQVRPQRSIAVRAIATGGGGSASSRSLTINPSSLRARSASTGLRSGQLIGSRLSGRGRTDRSRTRRIFVRVNGRIVWRGSVSQASDGTFRLPRVALGSTKPRVQIGAVNAWGTRWSTTVRLYNLGSRTPGSRTFLLVDKSSCLMYDVRNRVVRRVYGVAVGMPATPTPQGYFTLGRPQAASGAWGVLRRPLLRNGRGTSYYIHGTNDPSSIGTWASHGCVRMFNSHIRLVSRTVPNGTVVYIRY